MKSIFSIAAFSPLFVASLGCDAGLTLRPQTPTFVAHAEFGGSGGPAAPAPLQPVAVTPAAEPGYYSQVPAAMPTGPNGHQQSGGMDTASAQVVTVGTRIVGRVSKGAPRYYALDFAVGDSMSFKVYARRLQKETRFSARILEPDNVALARVLGYVTAPSSEFERMSMNATASQSGRHILKIQSDEPVEYRIESISANQAGM